MSIIEEQNLYREAEQAMTRLKQAVEARADAYHDLKQAERAERRAEAAITRLRSRFKANAVPWPQFTWNNAAGCYEAAPLFRGGAGDVEAQEEQ